MEKLIETISQVMKENVELTFRGVGEYTASFEGKNDDAVKRFNDFFAGQLTSVESDYDEECDLTCIWFDIA